MKLINVNIDEQQLSIVVENMIQKKLDDLGIDNEGIGDFAWLEEVTGLSRPTILQKILYPFRNELEDSIVSYPRTKNAHWRICKKPMLSWINENFEKINF